MANSCKTEKTRMKSNQIVKIESHPDLLPPKKKPHTQKTKKQKNRVHSNSQSMSMPYWNIHCNTQTKSTTTAVSSHSISSMAGKTCTHTVKFKRNEDRSMPILIFFFVVSRAKKQNTNLLYIVYGHIKFPFDYIHILQSYT